MSLLDQLFFDKLMASALSGHQQWTPKGLIQIEGVGAFPLNNTQWFSDEYGSLSSHFDGLSPTPRDIVIQLYIDHVVSGDSIYNKVQVQKNITAVSTTNFPPFIPDAVSERADCPFAEATNTVYFRSPDGYHPVVEVCLMLVPISPQESTEGS